MDYLNSSGISSKQDQIAEFMYNSFRSNGDDCAGFITTMTNLFKDHNGVDFDPYGKQIEFMNLLNPQDKLIMVEKPRQSGYSTSIVGKACFEAYFNLCPEIVVVSATRTQAEKVLDRIKKALKSMPEIFRPIFVTENKMQLELANGVKIYSLSSNPDGARGFTGNVYLDEFAMLGEKNGGEIFTSLYPTITKGGRITIISTPKGKRNKYYQLISSPTRDTDVAKKVIYRIDWREVPHIKYAVENQGLFDQLTQKEIDQEYNIVYFDESEEAFFTDEFLSENFIDRDGDIFTIKSYRDMGLGEAITTDGKGIFELDLNMPLPNHLKMKNNPDFSFLMEQYDDFTGAWDIAATRDDSIVGIMGRRRGTKNNYEMVARFPKLKDISSNIIEQAKYVKRIISFFEPRTFGGDYKGLGRGAIDFLVSDPDPIIANCIIKYETTEQTKMDSYVDNKDLMNKGCLKMRYDGTKEDDDLLKHFTNTAEKGRKIVKIGGKDDFADMFGIWNRTKDMDNSSQFSFYVI